MSAASSTVKERLTRKRTVETPEYVAAARRFIRAAGRRVTNGDEVDLAELLTLRDALDIAIQEGVNGIKARGESWAYIGRGAGISREAAYQKWGQK